MPDTVARKVELWLDDEFTKWEHGRDVVEWLEPFGHDLERAWAECPSPTMMLAIAGAHDVDPELVVPPIAEIVRAAVMTLPTSFSLPRKALVVAEQFDPRGQLLQPTELTERFSALWDEVMASVSRAESARQRAEIAAIEAIAVLGAATPDTASTDALALLSVGAWREATARVRELVAQANTVRAASSALAVATSASLSIHTAFALARLLQQSSGDRASLRRMAEVIPVHRAARAQVFSEAALAVDLAAAALGELSAAAADVWAAATPRVVDALLTSTERPVDAETHGLHRGALHAAAQREKLASLADHAELLRDRLPASSLRHPEDGDDDGKIPDDPRALLTRRLAALAPLAQLLGAADVTDVVEVALAILRVPGPLDKDALARVMRELHTRVAGMFRLRVEETEGEQREEALRALANAEEAAAEIDAVLAKIDPAEAN